MGAPMEYTLTEQQKLNKLLIQNYTYLAYKYPHKFELITHITSDFILVYRLFEIVEKKKMFEDTQYEKTEVGKVDLTLSNDFNWRWK